MNAVRCFLLSSLKYGDYDAILHCYSAENGYQSYFVKNIHTPRSKKKAYLFPMNELEISVSPSKAGKMPTVSGIELLKSGYDIQNQYANTILMFASDFLNQVLREENGNPKLYSLLAEFRENIMKTDMNAHLKLVFSILRWNGFLPLVSSGEFLNPETGEFGTQKYHEIFDERISGVWKFFLNNQKDNAELKRADRSRFLDSLLMYYKIHFSGFKIPESYGILKQVYE
ncbi:MAG: recombination protein O N-terminal domain-containing protein [Bergeyella sp.]